MIYKKILFKIFSLYPPFLGAGISVKISKDVKNVHVAMKLTWWNRNYVGTHFGGSLYSMCDPFFMFLLMENLGLGYIVWDKSASITFKNPGKGTVYANFHIPEEKYQEIKEQAYKSKKIYPTFTVDVMDKQGNVVATVEKVIYIKKKDKKR